MTNDISYGPIRNTFVVALDVLVEKTSDSMNFAMNGFRLVNCCRGVKVPVKMVCHSDVVLAFKKNDKRAIAGVRKTSKTNNFLVTNQMHRNFRYQRGNSWGFKSLLAHQKNKILCNIKI